jgi:hypothetical protein
MGIDSVGSRPVVPPPVTTQPVAPAATTVPASTPAEGQTVGAPQGHSAQSTFAPGSPEDVKYKSTQATEAAEANYAKNGDQVFDLSTQGGREGLVTQSPQIDNLNGTTSDKTRCGGACLADAMILDGDHKANAAAMTRVMEQAEKAKDQKVNAKLESGEVPTAAELAPVYSEDEKKAVKALGTGKMTPNQAAHLQEAMMKTAEHLPPPAGQDPRVKNFEPGRGITAPGMANTAAALNAHGGLKNAGNIEFNGEVRQNADGKPYNHWTMTSRDKSLFPTNIDPMPNASGQKTLSRREPDPSPSFVKGPDGKSDVSNPKFLAQVVLYPKQDGETKSLVDVRTTGIKHPETKATLPIYANTRIDVTPGKPDDTVSKTVMRDKDTHEPI